MGVPLSHGLPLLVCAAKVGKMVVVRVSLCGSGWVGVGVVLGVLGWCWWLQVLVAACWCRCSAGVVAVLIGGWVVLVGGVDSLGC